MLDRANIQVLDRSNNWVTQTNVNSSSVYVNPAMQSIAARFPNQRVRAVDASSGRLIDML